MVFGSLPSISSGVGFGVTALAECVHRRFGPLVRRAHGKLADSSPRNGMDRRGAWQRRLAAPKSPFSALGLSRAGQEALSGDSPCGARSHRSPHGHSDGLTSFQQPSGERMLDRGAARSRRRRRLRGLCGGMVRRDGGSGSYLPGRKPAFHKRLPSRCRCHSRRRIERTSALADPSPDAIVQRSLGSFPSTSPAEWLLRTASTSGSGS